MQIATTIALTVMRIAGPAAVILGVMIWTGYFYVVLPIHMLVGILVVLALWTLATVAAFTGASRGLAALALVWGIIVPLLGITHASLLPGPFHWIIQVIHLAVGMVAMVLGGRLATMIRATQKPAQNTGAAAA
jgi:hypothetical protein